MPAEAPEIAEPSIDPSLPAAQVDSRGLAPSLESRLSPEQIAQLDEMNAGIFETADAIPPIDPAAPAPPVAPVSPTPPIAPKPPVAPTPPPDGLLPPDDSAPADAPPAAPTDAPKDVLPDGTTLFPDDAIDKLRTEKSKGDIRGLREHYENARGIIAKHEATIAELQKKASGDENNVLVEDLKRRNAELNAIVEQKSIEDHPWFKQNFTGPRAQLLAFAEKALGYAEVPPEDLKRALGLPEGKERIAALDQLFEGVQSPTLRAQLESAVSQIAALDERRTSFLADREGNAAKMMADQKTQQIQSLKAQEATVKSWIDKTIQSLGEKSVFFRKSDKPGYEQWNKNFDADRSQMEELLLRNDDPSKLVTIGVLGLRAGRIMAAYDKMRDTNASLQKEIAELRGVRPSINGSIVPSGQSAPADQIDPNEDLATAAARMIREVSSGI